MLNEAEGAPAGRVPVPGETWSSNGGRQASTMTISVSMHETPIMLRALAWSCAARSKPIPGSPTGMAHSARARKDSCQVVQRHGPEPADDDDRGAQQPVDPDGPQRRVARVIQRVQWRAAHHEGRDCGNRCQHQDQSAKQVGADGGAGAGSGDGGNGRVVGCFFGLGLVQEVPVLIHGLAVLVHENAVDVGLVDCRRLPRRS